MSRSDADNRRHHDRVPTNEHAVFVEERSGAHLAVSNIGYSGMLLVGKLPGAELPGGEIAGTLSLLDLSIKVRGHVVRANASGLGVMLDHSDGAVLESLRLVLDPARYGTTMVAMNKAYVADAYKAPEWLVFQGLGPTVLTAKFDSPQHERVTEFALTIRPGGYQVVELKDGQLSTGTMKEGAGGFKTAVFDMSVTEHRHAVRRAASVLMGMRDLPLGKTVAPLLAVLKQALKA